MKQIKVTYAKAESCFYEALRINKGGASNFSSLKEGNALINSALSGINYEVIPHHPALNPDDYNTHHRGQGIADYHKSVTGRSARMNGLEEQRSKAVGVIITLPKDYIHCEYQLTEKEYEALETHIESGTRNEPSTTYYKNAISKINSYRFGEEELTAIKVFFHSAYNAWKKNAGIRDEDILYAIVHLDESWPHLHIMALPTVEKESFDQETGEVKTSYTFSTDKFNNTKTHYYDTLHSNIIRLMAEDGIDASGLLNGATKDGEYIPANANREQRQKGSQNTKEILALKNKLIAKEKELSVKENKLQQMEKALKHKDQQLAKVKENLVTIINKQIKKKLTLIIEEKIREIFDTINEFIRRRFKGKRQEKLFDQISHLTLPPEFVMDGYNYGGKTIAEAMAEAGERDMKELLINSDHSDITDDNDYGITESLIHGNGIDDIAEQIQDEIDDIDLD